MTDSLVMNRWNSWGWYRRIMGIDKTVIGDTEKTVSMIWARTKNGNNRLPKEMQQRKTRSGRPRKKNENRISENLGKKTGTQKSMKNGNHKAYNNMKQNKFD